MSSHILWFAAPVGAVWILALCTPRVRRAFLNGTRCVSRHPGLWKIPAAFALTYGLFQFAGFLLLHWPARLLHFAVRRLKFVLKWVLLIVTATLALIHLPLLVEAWFTGEPAGWEIFTLLDTFAVPAFAAVILALASVQIRLTLHNDSLRGAIATHTAFLRRHGLTCLILFLAAATIFLVLTATQSVTGVWLEETAWAPVATVSLQTVAAATGGWIFATWVCFYKSCEPGTRDIAF